MFVETATGARIPAIGLGTWKMQGAECERAVRTALDLGYRHIDTAQIYGNEDAVGRAIRDAGVPRDQLFVTTKIWRDHLGMRDVVRTTDESLRRLGLEYVDLLLVHWPNERFPLEETFGGLAQVRARRKARHIGVSNFPTALMERARTLGPVACNQVEYHVLLGQDRLLSSARAAGIAIAAYSPLAHGHLVAHPTLEAIGANHGKTASQVALRWLVQQGVAVIPKASQRRHLADNLAVLDFDLTAGDLAAIEALPKHQRFSRPSFEPAWD